MRMIQVKDTQYALQDVGYLVENLKKTRGYDPVCAISKQPISKHHKCYVVITNGKYASNFIIDATSIEGLSDEEISNEFLEVIADYQQFLNLKKIWPAI